MAENRIRFPGNNATLGGMVSKTENPSWCVTLAHPHPQYGGNMDNNAVRLVAHHLNKAGIATFRFDFRGAGTSTGRYSAGKHEVDDLATALIQAKKHFPQARHALYAYSFGSWVAWLWLLKESDNAAQLPVVLVSPAVDFLDYPTGTATNTTMVLAGDLDAFLTLPGLDEFIKGLPNAKAQIVRRADHFWVGREAWLAAQVEEFLGGL